MAERKNSEARIRTNNKWTNAHYDRINIAVPKGRKDKIKAIADKQGQSVNAYIISAIDEMMERDSSLVALALDGPRAPETLPDGALVLIERGPVSVGRGDMRTMYSAQDTGREYYVEPVISDDEWNDLQRAKDTGSEDPNELPF